MVMRYLILGLMFVSSVCYAHPGDGTHSHANAFTPAGLCEHYPGNPFVKWACDVAKGITGNPGGSIVSNVPDDASTDDDDASTDDGFFNPEPPIYIPKPLIVTEYMLRDWSRSGRGGLPQWIELYNPNPKPVSLEGYRFTHVYKRFAHHPWKYVTTSITGFTIPASSTAIIANRSAGTGSWQIGGISKENVWIIPYAEEHAQLKNGWYLTDPEGEVVHRMGTVFREYPADDPSAWDTSLGQPELPAHASNGYRVSYQSFPSGSPDGDYFYGDENDVGSPGFYEEAAPAAPSLQPLQRPKLTTTWGHLKRKS